MGQQFRIELHGFNFSYRGPTSIRCNLLPILSILQKGGIDFLDQITLEEIDSNPYNAQEFALRCNTQEKTLLPNPVKFIVVYYVSDADRNNLEDLVRLLRAEGHSVEVIKTVKDLSNLS